MKRVIKVEGDRRTKEGEMVKKASAVTGQSKTRKQAGYWLPHPSRVRNVIIGLIGLGCIVWLIGYFQRLNPQPILSHLHHPFKRHPISDMSIPTAAVKKTATVIFSHGLGDTSAGWAFLANELGQHLPWVKWVFPNAPSQKVTMNHGLKMNSWFDIVALEPDAQEDEAGLLASVHTIQSFVNQEVNAGTPSDRIVVGGFSQGATIAILTGLMSPKPLAGVIALSGFLPLHKKIKDLEGPYTSQLPVFWGHGMEDPVVKYSWGSQSVGFLQQDLGLSNVEFRSYPGLVHSASPAELNDLLTWLKTRLPNQ